LLSPRPSAAGRNENCPSTFHDFQLHKMVVRFSIASKGKMNLQSQGKPLLALTNVACGLRDF
jgi:hypothetical protein